MREQKVRFWSVIRVVILSGLFGVAPDGFGEEESRLRIQQAEAQLKDLGFYSGPVDGNETPALSGAIRRYQIRQGLEVTGKLSKETVEALGLEGVPAESGPGQPVREPLPEPVREPVLGALPVPPERERPVVKAERVLPVPSASVGGGGGVSRRSYPASDPKEEYGRILEGTPYERAPLEVQALVVHRAQDILSQRGFYRGKLHGAVTPEFGEAVLGYQRSRGLVVSGCLDLRTLQRMEMLPGMRAAPVARRTESRAVFKEVP
jgi:peptidoglycan hydrolase-like protein with peptidoglycan-binding domain